MANNSSALFAWAPVLPCCVRCQSPGLATTAVAYPHGEKYLGFKNVIEMVQPSCKAFCHAIRRDIRLIYKLFGIVVISALVFMKLQSIRLTFSRMLLWTGQFITHSAACCIVMKVLFILTCLCSLLFPPFLCDRNWRLDMSVFFVTCIPDCYIWLTEARFGHKWFFDRYSLLPNWKLLENCSHHWSW